MEQENIVAEDIAGAVRLRLRRLTSTTLVKQMLIKKGASFEENLLLEKAEGTAWAVNSALGYWEPSIQALNARLLSRYYALMQISIAEQVSNINGNDTLVSVQKSTEEGHGLFIVHKPGGQFPDNVLIGCQKRGHFYHYCKSRNIDLDSVVSENRPREWKEKYEQRIGVSLVSLSDLLARIPECAMTAIECFGRPPLSLQVSGGTLDASFSIEDWAPTVLGVAPGSKSVPNLVSITPYKGQTLEWLLNLSDKTFGGPTLQVDTMTGSDYISARLNTDAKLDGWFSSRTYKSGYCPTSYIIPFWNDINDPFILHYVILYALSIIVRYEPLLWHDIDVGRLDHIRALLEQYAFMTDQVLPILATERVTGRRLFVVQPGSLYGPL